MLRRIISRQIKMLWTVHYGMQPLKVIKNSTNRDLSIIMADKRIFFILTLFLCLVTEEAYTQGKRSDIAVDSIKVSLYDFESRTHFDYCFFQNQLFICGEKTTDSISKPMRLEPYKQYHEYRELRWNVRNTDTITSFVNYAQTIVDNPDRNWVEECPNLMYEADKMHLDVYVYQEGKTRHNRIILDPNCRYTLLIDKYVSFLQRLGWL